MLKCAHVNCNPNNPLLLISATVASSGAIGSRQCKVCYLPPTTYLCTHVLYHRKLHFYKKSEPPLRKRGLINWDGMKFNTCM